MKTKQLMILLAALAVVAGLYFLTSDDEDAPQMFIGKEPLAALPMNKIQSIQITGVTIDESGTNVNTLTLSRSAEGWQVGNGRDYPADTDRIERFVKEFTEMKVLRQVPASAKQLGRIHLTEPAQNSTNTATRVTLLGVDKQAIYTLHLGKTIAGPSDSSENTSIFGGGNFPDRRFVMVNGERASIAVVDQTFSNAETEPSRWLNKDYFKIENANHIAVTFGSADATNSWSVAQQDVNGTEQWILSDANQTEKLDPDKVPTSPFASPSFDDVATAAQAMVLDANATRIEIGTADGFVYSIVVSPKNTEGGFTIKMDVNASFAKQRTAGAGEKPEDKARLDTEWTEAQSKLKDKLKSEKKYTQKSYQVPGYIVEPLLKKRGELLAEKDAVGPLNPLSPLQNFPPLQPKPDN
jgi:hypothetical protein